MSISFAATGQRHPRFTSRRAPLGLRALAVLSFLAISGCAGSFARFSPLAAFETANVFLPVKYPQGDWDAAAHGAEDAWFSAADGTRLHGWHLPHADPAAVVLFAHGNAGNVSLQAESLRTLHDEHHLSVMTFDYRGYGRSAGHPDEAGILQDARAARAWLAQREQLPESEIVLLGHSLGGGVMIDLAANDGARGLVVASTFTSLPDVASAHAPFVPARWLMRNRLESIEKIGNYRGPLLIIHGDADEVIPYEQGLSLYQAANEPKAFVTKPGARHNDPMSHKERRALDAFLASLP
jgi:uncharacterized protein